MLELLINLLASSPNLIILGHLNLSFAEMPSLNLTFENTR